MLKIPHVTHKYTQKAKCPTVALLWDECTKLTPCFLSGSWVSCFITGFKWLIAVMTSIVGYCIRTSDDVMFVSKQMRWNDVRWGCCEVRASGTVRVGSRERPVETRSWRCIRLSFVHVSSAHSRTGAAAHPCSTTPLYTQTDRQTDRQHHAASSAAASSV